MCTHNLCFEQEYEKYQNFLSENFPCLVVKFSIYLNRCVFVMHFYKPWSFSYRIYPTYPKYSDNRTEHEQTM